MFNFDRLKELWDKLERDGELEVEDAEKAYYEGILGLVRGSGYRFIAYGRKEKIGYVKISKIDL